MTNYPDIYVLRHGQTEWNREGRFQGQQDSALTELGERQAKQQGDLLRDLKLDYETVSVFCSPLQRASRTASLAGLTAKPDPRLKELYFGSLEGRLKSETSHLIPDFDKDGDLTRHFNSPDGERFETMRDRCQSFLDDLNGPAVIVAHGITSIVLRGLWLGLDRQGMGALPIGQGCIYCLNDLQETVLDRVLT